MNKMKINHDKIKMTLLVIYTTIIGSCMIYVALDIVAAYN